MIVDATDLILGRMASFVAKKALTGEPITIINCEKAIISGDRRSVLARYARKRDRGIPRRGPFFYRNPEQFVKRTIRGMLPYRKALGEKALKSVMCYEGVPDEFAGKESVTLEEANVSKLPNIKFITVGMLCKQLGGKQ